MTLRSSALIIFLSFLFSCSNKETESSLLKIEEVNILFDQIEIEEISLEIEPNSFIGFFEFGRGNLYYIDQLYSTITVFDQELNTQNTFLGKGEGPTEQNVINGFQPYATGDQHIILGSNEFNFFDREFTKTTKAPIEWHYPNETYNQMMNSPDASMIGLYEINWKGKGTNNHFHLSQKDNSISIPVEMSHPLLNGYKHEEYYQTVRLFGIYDLDVQKINEVKGFRSKTYLDHKFIPNFDFINFSNKADSILVSFPPDPLIHILDTDFNLIGQFGIEGKGMNRNYPVTQNPEDALSNYNADLEKAGYYDHIKYDQQSGLVFRSYFPDGKGKGNSRIQIYRNYTLIGDFEVPERFRVLGSKDDYFYADGLMDEKNEVFGIYKFRLK